MIRKEDIHPRQPKECIIITEDAITDRPYTCVYCVLIYIYGYIKYNSRYSHYTTKDIPHIHSYCIYVYKIRALVIVFYSLDANVYHSSYI